MMIFKNKLYLLLCLFIASTNIFAQPLNPIENISPLPVTFDNQSVIVNGERLLLISGAVHYPRATPDMWPHILEESKAAGINCIETYVFWEGHERVKGEYDFSGRYNLPLFLEMCKNEGLYVILRVGPYICAEWNNGGLPWWIIKVPGLTTRTWNKPYMKIVERWVMDLGQKMNKYLITNGGPIILVQMENEYNNVAARYGDDGQRYLKWSEELGEKARFNVPMLMCEGASDSSIETLNGNSVWKRVRELHLKRPVQPALWTENYTGWYDIWGENHKTRKTEEICTEVMRFFAVGGAGVNYYMWFGGTNFERNAMYLQTTSYDYDAPIDEYGLPTEKMEKLKALNLCLLTSQQVLLEGERLPVEKIIQNGEIVGEIRRIRWHEQEIVFIFNDIDTDININFYDNPLKISPHNGAILKKTDNKFELKYKSGEIPEHHVRIESILSNITLKWSTIQDSSIFLNDSITFEKISLPHNMLKITCDETDYGWYKTTFHTKENGEVMLSVRVADRLSIWLDGNFVTTIPEKLVENRRLSDNYQLGEIDSQKFSVGIPINIKPGEHKLLLLVSSLGMIKGDWMIDLPQSEEKKGLLSQVYINDKKIKSSWSFSPAMFGEREIYYSNIYKETKWHPISKVQPFSWYKAIFFIDKKQIVGDPWMLDATGLGKGMIWINGKCIGRYWQNNGPQQFYHKPKSWLNLGENKLVILEEEENTPLKVKLLRRHKVNL